MQKWKREREIVQQISIAIFCSRPKVGNTFWQSANCDSWHLNAPSRFLLLSLSLSAILYLALPFCPSLSPPSLWASLYSLSLALIAVPAARKWNLNRSVYCSLDAIITRSVCHHSIMSPSPPSPLTHSTSTLFLGPLRVKFLAFLWNSISKLYHFHLISRFQFASQPTVGIPRN